MGVHQGMHDSNTEAVRHNSAILIVRKSMYHDCNRCVLDFITKLQIPELSTMLSPPRPVSELCDLISDGAKAFFVALLTAILAGTQNNAISAQANEFLRGIATHVVLASVQNQCSPASEVKSKTKVRRQLYVQTGFCPDSFECIADISRGHWRCFRPRHGHTQARACQDHRGAAPRDDEHV